MSTRPSAAKRRRATPKWHRAVAVRISIRNVLALFVALAAVTCVAVQPEPGGEALYETLQGALKESFNGKLVYVSRTPLPADSVVSTWRARYEVPANFPRAWFYFIDDNPGANWEHPCRYVFVDVATRRHVVIEARTPPNTLRSMLLLPNER